MRWPDFKKAIKRFLPVFFILSISCTTKVTIKSVAPPEKLLLPARRIAVAKFKNDHGDTLRALLEAKLSSTTVFGKRFYILSDRSDTDKLLKEMVFEMDYGNAQKAADIGKILHVDAIITGTILSKRVGTHRYYERRTECLDKKCKKRRSYQVSCYSKEASFSFIPKVIEVETAKLLYSNNYEATATFKWCEDRRPSSIPTDASLLHQAMEKAVERFVRDITPHEITVVVVFKKYNGENPEAKRLVKDAISFAKAKDIDKALSLLQRAKRLDPNSYAVFYDMGVCYEIKRDFENALRAYHKAMALLSKPDEDVYEAVERTQKALAAIKSLTSR